jgi:hypothetical protein
LQDCSRFFHAQAAKISEFHDSPLARVDLRQLKINSARNYDPALAGVDEVLTHRLGPVEAVLTRLDPLLIDPPRLTADDFEDLVSFVRT